MRPPCAHKSRWTWGLFAPLILLCMNSTPVFSQTQGFPTPMANGSLGAKDPNALAEVESFIQVTGGSAWQDLVGTGTLSYQDGQSHPATLYLQGSGSSRLDIDMGSGSRSVRLIASAGTFQDESAGQHPLLPNTSRIGIVAFPRVWTDAATSPLVSLFDHGLYAGTGQPLHRVTVEYQLNPGSYAVGDPTVATDLYFDPNTHLLLFSVDSVRFANAQQQVFLQSIAYGAYQTVNGVSVPTSLIQTLNDQPQWALQLSQITLNSHPTPDTFSF